MASSKSKTTYQSIKTRVLNTLRQGKSRRRTYSASQLQEKLNLSSKEVVYSTISTLLKEGHEITKKEGQDGFVRYGY